jgi:hypothetical protein
MKRKEPNSFHRPNALHAYVGPAKTPLGKVERLASFLQVCRNKERDLVKQLARSQRESASAEENLEEAIQEAREADAKFAHWQTLQEPYSNNQG